MVIAEIVTLFFYIISMAFLPEYFGECLMTLPRELHISRHCTDLSFVITVRFIWKVALIVAISSFPLYLIKFIRGRVKPATYTKLSS